MAEYNLDNIDDVVYNGTSVDEVIYNGTLVWQKSVKIGLTFSTDSQYVLDNDEEWESFIINQGYTDITWFGPGYSSNMNDVDILIVNSNNGSYSSLSGTVAQWDSLECHIISMSRWLSRMRFELATGSGHQTDRRYQRVSGSSHPIDDGPGPFIYLWNRDYDQEGIWNLTSETEPIYSLYSNNSRYGVVEGLSSKGYSRIHYGAYKHVDLGVAGKRLFNSALTYLSDLEPAVFNRVYESVTLNWTVFLWSMLG